MMKLAPPRQAPRSLDQPANTSGTDGLNDDRLLERFRLHHDQVAFEVLVRRHGPMVWRVCRRFLYDSAAAEDAYQETFIVFLRKAHLLSQPERLAGWLYGVAARTALKARRRTERRAVHEKRAASAQVADAFAEVTRRDVAALLAAAVNGLPQAYRAALILCYWEGKTAAEAARELGCPIGSMSWRLSRGRELLRERLSQREKTTAGSVPTDSSRSGRAAVPGTLLRREDL